MPHNLRLTPKSYMIIILSVIAATTMAVQRVFYLQIILIPVMASLIDVAINYAKLRKIILPSSAVVSGLLLAMVLEPIPAGMQAMAALVAMLSKRIVRWKGRHIFNPAAFSMVMMSLLGVHTAWWGASLPVIAIGMFIPYRQMRLQMVAAFLATYFTIVSVTSSFSLDYGAMFFSFFMLLEPMTSPYRKKACILFGAFTAIIAFLLNPFQGVDKLLLALVVMNAFTDYLNRKF